jgi:hypothetical protein
MYSVSCAPCEGLRRPNITNIEKEGEGGAGVVSDAQPAPRGGDIEAMQQKAERDATPDLLLKTSRCSTCNIHLMIDETLETCI